MCICARVCTSVSVFLPQTTCNNTCKPTLSRVLTCARIPVCVRLCVCVLPSTQVGALKQETMDAEQRYHLLHCQLGVVDHTIRRITSGPPAERLRERYTLRVNDAEEQVRVCVFVCVCVCVCVPQVWVTVLLCAMYTHQVQATYHCPECSSRQQCAYSVLPACVPPSKYVTCLREVRAHSLCMDSAHLHVGELTV